MSIITWLNHSRMEITMPLPLKPGENIYIDHKIKEASYTMPAMQAAHQVIEDGLQLITYVYATPAILGLLNLRFITGTVLYRMFLMTDM